MTSSTFFSDSGTASYCMNTNTISLALCIPFMHECNAQHVTYQLIPTIDVHEPIEQIEDLDPQNADVGYLAIAGLELHERLAKQSGSP